MEPIQPTSDTFELTEAGNDPILLKELSGAPPAMPSSEEVSPAKSEVLEGLTSLTKLAVKGTIVSIVLVVAFPFTLGYLAGYLCYKDRDYPDEGVIAGLATAAKMPLNPTLDYEKDKKVKEEMMKSLALITAIGKMASKPFTSETSESEPIA